MLVKRVKGGEIWAKPSINNARPLTISIIKRRIGGNSLPRRCRGPGIRKSPPGYQRDPTRAPAEHKASDRAEE
ncbi:hypothetical protein M8494_21795 [Serratia ureilytica]